MNIRLYTTKNISNLVWPETKDGLYAKAYLLPLVVNGSQTYIKNVHTDLCILQIDELILPITVTDYHPENSYVCSPYNHYFAYGEEEFGKLGNPIMETALRVGLWPLFQMYRHSNFDKVALVNNWLLSTNLYPAIPTQQVRVATEFLIEHFPNRPVIWRSVDALGNPNLHQTLLNLDYQMVFSRQVYYQSPKEALGKKQVKIDLGKYKKSPYRLIDGCELGPADVPRIAQLYRLLYLEKYSYFNPQFTEAFFRLALERGLFTFKAFVLESKKNEAPNSSLTPESRPLTPLFSEGRIDAVMGYFCRNGIMTQPIFGYDTHLPQSLGLYRLLSTQVVLEGQHRQLLVNCSGGVGHFKRLRGSRPALEYNAVYSRHLPQKERLPWLALQQVLDRVAVPVIQHYGF